MPANPVYSRPASAGPLHRLADNLKRYGVELILLALLGYLCVSRGLAVSIDVHDPTSVVTSSEPVALASFAGWLTRLRDRTATTLTVEERYHIESYDDFGSVAETDDPAPHISNLTLVLSPDYGERKGLAPEIIAAKRQRVSNYIRRHAAAARAEQQQYGIPASITLAQALLESNAGDSKLAVNSNNHFGIKCRAKCLGCTCRNYGDDTRYDMFRVFDSVADSFREHSILLTSPRYARLRQYGTDYRKWAHGPRACGYATDKRYGHKLITIIENLNLNRFDS